MEIETRWFYSDLHARILRVAMELDSDPNYSREEAVDALQEIAQIVLDVIPGHARKVSTPHND